MNYYANNGYQNINFKGEKFSMTQKTDQIRRLKNDVCLAGKLLELSDVREGTTQKGIDYISFKGIIGYDGENKACTQRFSAFIQAKKSDGNPSKIYPVATKWVQEAVPATENPENPTMVQFRGSLVDNPFVNKEGKLVEATEFRVSLIGDFKEYKADIDLEGFIQAITEEEVNDDATGRYKMTLFTRDIFNNNLSVKNIIIDAETYKAMMDAGDYERGVTATFFISLKAGKVAQPVKGGFGVQRVGDQTTRSEWMLCGATPPIDLDSEQALSNAIVKAAMAERAAKLKEIEDKGYQGKSAVESTNRSGFGKTKTDTSTEDFVELVEEDLPF